MIVYEGDLMIFPFIGVSEISLKHDELERDYSSHGVSGCSLDVGLNENK